MKLPGVFRFIQTEIDKTRNFYREFGLWKTILRFLENIGVFKRRVFTFLEMELKDSVSVQEQDHGIHLVRAGKEDLEKVGPYLYEWFEKEEALRRLDAGNVLLVVKDGEKMVFYQWFDMSRKIDLPYLDLPFSMPDGTVYMVHMFTEPAYRGKGIATRAKPLIFKYMQENGIRKLLSIIASSHEESLHINRKVGLIEYQIVNYLRFLFLKYYCVKDLHTDSRKVFWGSGRASQELWRTFSKINPMDHDG